MDNVYLIGIGGIGMSALARYYKHNNLFVAGYDRTPSNLTSHLQAEGIDINFQDSVDIIPKRIKDNPDSLIIFTPAIPKDSAQLQWFKDNDYKILKRSQALGYLAASKKCLAVAGTHGKTTTSTLLAHLLHDSGEGCTAFLGGISSNYNTNLILSKNNVLVAEADEFDRSFLQLWPEIAVVTSADADHLDIYNNHETILGAFADFAG
ncbi:MAG: Mur ligase domain-containing protein, partial [Bacteroidales bacterium]